MEFPVLFKNVSERYAEFYKDEEINSYIIGFVNPENASNFGYILVGGKQYGASYNDIIKIAKENIDVNAEVIIPPIKLNNTGDPNDENRYLAYLSLDTSSTYYHTLTAEYHQLPTIPPIIVYHSKNGNRLIGPIPETYYINKIQSEGHTLNAYLEEIPASPTVSPISVTGNINNDTAIDKYITGISALGHSISYTYSDLPKLPSLKQGTKTQLSGINATGYYLSGLHISHNTSDNSYTVAYTFESVPELSIDCYDADSFKHDFSNTVNYPWYDKSLMEGKFVSYVGIIPESESGDNSKHTLTTVISDLPKANQLWGNYVPAVPYGNFMKNGKVILSSFANTITQPYGAEYEFDYVIYNYSKLNNQDSKYNISLVAYNNGNIEALQSSSITLTELSKTVSDDDVCTYNYKVTLTEDFGIYGISTNIKYYTTDSYNYLCFKIVQQPSDIGNKFILSTYTDTNYENPTNMFGFLKNESETKTVGINILNVSYMEYLIYEMSDISTSTLLPTNSEIISIDLPSDYTNGPKEITLHIGQNATNETDIIYKIVLKAAFNDSTSQDRELYVRVTNMGLKKPTTTVAPSGSPMQ